MVPLKAAHPLVPAWRWHAAPVGQPEEQPHPFTGIAVMVMRHVREPHMRCHRHHRHRVVGDSKHGLYRRFMPV